MRCNNNAFVFNTMLGYITAFVYIKNKYWYWDEVNSNAATCYIQFINDLFDYIQSVHPYDDILPIKDNEIFVERTHVSHLD